MTNPAIVSLTAGVWTKVATAVQSCTVWPLIHPAGSVYYVTERDTGGSAPTNLSDAIPLIWGWEFKKGVASDIYAMCLNKDGSVRVSLGVGVITSVQSESAPTMVRSDALAGVIAYTLPMVSAYKLIGIDFSYGTAPTTAGNVTINTINSSSDTIEQDVFDPSILSKASHTRRFDREFSAGHSINVVYANPNSRTIRVIVHYRVLGA